MILIIKTHFRKYTWFSCIAKPLVRSSKHYLKNIFDALLIINIEQFTPDSENSLRDGQAFQAYATMFLIKRNIDTVSSITNIIKPSKFVQLALVLSNLLLNRLTGEQKFLGHNGRLRMFLKSLPIVALILMN